MTTPSGSTAQQPAPPPPTRLRLERSKDDRYVGGVCGGLGRYFDIDPVVFRVALACLAIFGAGLIVYAIGWAFIPEEGDEFSVAQSARRDGAPGRELIVIVVVVLAGLAAVDAVFGRHDGFGRGGWVVPALAFCGFLWWRRTRGFRSGPPAQPDWPHPSTAPVAPPAPSAFWAATATTPMTAPATDASPATGAGSEPWAYRPRPPKAPRERSQLGGLTFSALLLGLGVAVLLDALGRISLSAQGALAAALVVVGAGLVVGAWYGRSRWLIALGLLLTFAVALAAVLDVPLRGGTGDRTWTVTGVDQLSPGFHLRAGSAVLDLTALEVGTGAAKTVDVSLGAGDLTVAVPEGVVVRVRGHVGAGTATVFDHSQDGFGLDVDEGDQGQPQLVINVRLGLGDLQVRHEAS